MKLWSRCDWLGSLVAATTVAAVLVGCSQEPQKTTGAKQGAADKKVSEPAKPAEPVAKPAAKPEEPAKPAEPVAKPEEAVAPPPAPAAKPEEPAAPAAKPEEPAKPAEPAAKPAESTGAVTGTMPTAPKISTFAPAEDLSNQVADYLKGFDKAVENEAAYKDAEGKIAKDANTLIVIALALGLHDQDNQYKASAAALIKAAQELAAAKDFASAQKGVESVKAAASATGGGVVKWEKIAALDQLMKQVPLVNTKLKRFVQGTRFKSRAKDSTGLSAVIAVIAEASMADTSVVKNPEDVQKWYAFCAQMRDAGAAVNTAVRAGDQPATEAAMAKLAQSCDDCHTVFHKAALGKTDVAE